MLVDGLQVESFRELIAWEFTYLHNVICNVQVAPSTGLKS